MADNNPNYFKSIVLALSFVLITLIYIFFDHGFVQCKIAGCKELDGNLISQVGNSTIHLSNASNTLANKIGDTTNKTTLVSNKAGESANLQNSLNNIETEISNAKIANDNTNANTLTLKRNAYNANLQATNRELIRLTAEKDKAGEDLSAARILISLRYSSRMIWIFLSAVFLMLCAAAVVFSGYVIWSLLENKRTVFLLLLFTFLFSLGFAIFVSFTDYMSFVKTMFLQSIVNGDLHPDWVSLSNVIGFAATIWLATASCSILYAVDNMPPAEVNKKRLLKLKIDHLTARLDAEIVEVTKETLRTELEKEEANLIELELDKFKTCKEYLWIILCISSAMLFVGIVRVDTLNKWHLSFVTYGQGSNSANLLQSFFTTTLGVQAGFYTILLAVIYLPAAYWIWVKQGGDKVDEQTTWYSSFSSYVTPFITIISPLLAKSFGDILTKLIGS